MSVPAAAREPFLALTSRYVTMPRVDVDTDQIIPARFLKATRRDGLAEGLFADWRCDAEGAQRPDFVLNRAQAEGAQILVAGHNFGCGSSREHAPWALLANGIRAVVSTGIADIFRNNALKNGLLPLVVSAEFHAELLDRGSDVLHIDLVEQTVALEDGPRATFEVEAFARHCLLNGIDEMDFLLQQEPAIAAYETGAR